ncbi:MAG: 2OG-Fe(II) oxygenase [Scytonematopsis contorta HA4267-MV1]|nr:2OG-Fe(II) oxygenase [Scytonematopsis contorta HA4267-MV1]
MHKVDLPDALGFVQESNTLTYLRRLMEKCFDVELAEQVDIQASKLERGQVIKIHTDYSVAQSHRLLIHLNHGWTYEQGGILMLLDSISPEDINPDQRFILPKSGSATGFEISPKSFHAVTPVISGARYTLQYSFYPAQ